jgi:3-hydroxyisobutyrate dehydrogenase-like beta-hydroxyacid dehydrogenase
MNFKTLGFIGLGVMGEPMCANLAATCADDERMVAFDIDPAPLARLAASGVVAVNSMAVLADAADLIFLSLPGGDELEAVCADLLAHCRAGQVVVDTSTAPVALTRDLAARFAAIGVGYADAPIARTRQAARDGTLSIMVGADDETFENIRPALDRMGRDVTHCGAVGAGQVVKLMNNMVLFQTVNALAEALTIGRRAGVEGEILFQALSNGSADSFALRNHGMKALLPGNFPERAFSTRYAQKDLSYALELAAEFGLAPDGAANTARILENSEEAGFGENYFPALLNVTG